MHSLQPQQNAQLRPRGHDENILEEAYRGRYARQRLLNFWPESSCGYHAIKRFVCIIQVSATSLFLPRVGEPLRIVFFASGGPGNLNAVLALQDVLPTKVSVSLVVTDRPNVPAID